MASKVSRIFVGALPRLGLYVTRDSMVLNSLSVKAYRGMAFSAQALVRMPVSIKVESFAKIKNNAD